MQPNTPVEQVRNIPALTLRAAVDGIDVEKRTAEMTWTTGARVLRGFFDRFWEELSLDPAHVRMGRLQSGTAPFLDSHNSWSLRSQLGVIETAGLEGKRGTARVRFSKRAEVEPIWNDVVDRIIQNVSVGYRVYKYERTQERVDDIPVYRAVDWEPYEVSGVAAGADADAGFRSAQGPDGPPPNTCIFVTRGEEKTSMEPQTPTPTSTTTPPADDATRSAEAVQAERQRGTEIRALVKRHGLDEKLGERLVSEGKSMDEARKAILEELTSRDQSAPTEQHLRAEVGEEDGEKWVRGATAWLLHKAGMAPMVRQAKEKNPEHEAWRNLSLDGVGQFRGASMVDLARHYLERRGVRVGLMSRQDVVKRALQERGTGGMQTTSDFAVLLENTLHKVLLGAYQTTPDTWSRICKTDSVSDFRDHPRYRLGSFGVLDSITEHGEFKNKVIPDGEKSVLNVKTKGNIIALTRQAIVNDDMGVFTGLASAFGRAAKLTIEVAFYSLLAENSGTGPTLSGNPFFHSSRSNVGTSSVLSVEGIDADRVVMGKQKDPSGNELLELRPVILLVPLELGGTARVINDAQYDPDTANKLQRPNKVRGLFRDVVDSARASAISTTRRWLFADPNVAPAFVVTFLDGMTEPVLESQEGWRVDGAEWKARLDFNVQGFDPRGGLTNAGT